MEIELDAKLVVDLLKKEVGNPNGNDAFVANCGEGLKEIPLVRVQHCYREANKCADALAKKGAILSQDFVVFVEPPSVALLLMIISFPPKKEIEKGKSKWHDTCLFVNLEIGARYMLVVLALAYYYCY